jgi:hypothetical protein
MKRITLCLLGTCLLVSCEAKKPLVDKAIENGIEIVLNHTQPYRLKGMPESLRLEQELAIDTERPDLAERGVVDIWGFGVNSPGEVFIFQSPMSNGNFISRFDAGGHFLGSFAPKGQGPREMQWPIFQKIAADDGLPVLDMITKKLLVLDEHGTILRVADVPLEIRGGALLLQLPFGNYLYRKVELQPGQEYPSMAITYSIINREFQDVKELDRVVIPHPFSASRIQFPVPLTCWAISGTRIFLGNPDKGYEIRVYDLEGNLVRKIRKESPAVPFPERKKLEVLKTLESPPLAVLKNKLDLPKSSPPYQHLFCDDEGRLYVMTYETGEKPGNYVFDIFTPDGVCFARTNCAAYLSANLYAPGSPVDSWMMAKKGRLYAIREKPNGYKELVIYKMIWK